MNNAVLKFLAVGVLNTVGGVSTIFLLKFAVGLNDYAANALGYATGLALSYFLNARWTFLFSGASHSRIWRFLAVVAFAYSVNLLFVSVFLSIDGVSSYAAQLAGVLPYAALTYVGCKRFVFSPVR